MENASFYVYIWSIYGNIKFLMEFLVAVLFCIGMITWLIGLETDDGIVRGRGKLFIIASFIFLSMRILMPSKEYLPLIISATPLSKAIIESATSKDGKLHKMDKLLDMGLDKALIEVEKTLKDKQ